MLFLPWIVVVFPSVAAIIVLIAFIALCLTVFVGPMGKCFFDKIYLKIIANSFVFKLDSFIVFGVSSRRSIMSEKPKKTERITIHTLLHERFEAEIVKHFAI